MDLSNSIPVSYTHLDKNNFFGIAAYDTSPYLSAKSFDNVDKGILGAAKWIRENYIDYGRDHLGNKATGMNVRYASDPYWGEKIASIMTVSYTHLDVYKRQGLSALKDGIVGELKRCDKIDKVFRKIDFLS